MRHSNLSIFIPHVGCRHRCAFCSQKTITAVQKIPRGEDVKRICRQALDEMEDTSNAQIAFFGGSFTAVPREYMIELLNAAYEFVGEGKFESIRISTRPDCIDREILGILKDHKVRSIELGAQSMCDDVLSANERGHTAEDVQDAAKLINSWEFELGLQMMVGLYKSTYEKEIESWEKICNLSPKTVRIYPVVILEDTKLGELYKAGIYKPIEFEQVVELCAKFLQDAEEKSIKVIKLGLHASRSVEEKILGGFYHPAFREICQGRIYREKILNYVKGNEDISKISRIFVYAGKSEISKIVGQNKCNVKYFKDMGISLKVIPVEGQEICVRMEGEK